MKIKHPVLRGHPVHAMLSDGPIALLPLALIAALIERGDRRRETTFASRSAATAAGATALAALTLGWWDWLTIPSDHEAYKPATLHGLINTAVTATAVAASRSPSYRVELLTAGCALLVVSAWIGGELVYRLGWRVRPAEELELLVAEGPPRLDVYRRAAREKIADHERADTFLPALDSDS
jgi:uncharacterized membrane protein